jgi:hypothetical protein
VLGDGEEWDVLDIGVVFWVICDEVVNVVVLLVSTATHSELHDPHHTTSRD